MKLAACGFDHMGLFVNAYYPCDTTGWQYVFQYDADESAAHKRHNEIIITQLATGVWHNPIGPCAIEFYELKTIDDPVRRIRVKCRHWKVAGHPYDPAEKSFVYCPPEHRELYESLGYEVYGNYRSEQKPDLLAEVPAYIEPATWTLKI